MRAQGIIISVLFGPRDNHQFCITTLQDFWTAGVWIGASLLRHPPPHTHSLRGVPAAFQPHAFAGTLCESMWQQHARLIEFVCGFLLWP